MELGLNLKNHCIASEIKKLYNRSVSDYLKKARKTLPDQAKPLEEKIAFLQTALENLDFAGLRSKYSVLAGKTDASVIIGLTDDLELYISIDGQKIELLFSQ